MHCEWAQNLPFISLSVKRKVMAVTYTVCRVHKVKREQMFGRRTQSKVLNPFTSFPPLISFPYLMPHISS
jgi:hypothetical protein